MSTLCESLVDYLRQGARIGGWWMDARGGSFHWTDNVRTLFGVKKQSASPSLDEALAFFSPYDQDKIHSALERALNKQESFDIEALVFTGTAAKHVRICGKYIHDIPGISLMGTVQDVSELKRLVQEVECNHSRYKNIIESAMDAIVSVDDSQTIVLFNREAERMFGWHVDEVLGKPLDILLLPRRRVAHVGHVQEPLQQEISHQVMGRSQAWWGIRKDGSEFPIEASLSRFDADNNSIATVIVRDVSATKDHEQRIHRLAFIDQLTGLANRNAIYNDFAELPASAVSLELALIDLDRFKDINDSLGHHVGDKALAEVGKILREIASEYRCRVYRLAGDEFVLISTGQTLERPCRRLLTKGNSPVLVDGYSLWPGLSIGLASWPEDGRTLEELIQCADAALQQAKQKGGGRLERFSADLFSYIEARVLLNSRLEESLEKHELYYCFQPIVDLSAGEAIGYEALAHWRHDGHLITPDIFVGLAEETGHIHRIQDYLFDYLAGCLDVLGESAYMALNISPSQFASDRFYVALQQFLSKTGFPPERLELELTERSLLLAGQEALSMIKRLKTLGVRLSIDDFGTGYSCLAYLKDLPIDKVKIGRSFVINIGNDPKNLAVVMTIINLAKNLGMSVVAEGIEHPSQVDILKKMGCRVGQGYWFSMPLSVEEMRAPQRTSGGEEA